MRRLLLMATVSDNYNIINAGTCTEVRVEQGEKKTTSLLFG